MITRRQLVRAAIGLGALPVAGCARVTRGEQVQATLFHFDTVCVLGGVMSQDLLDEGIELCAKYEQMLSRTLPDSDVSRINAARGAPTEVDWCTADVIAKALSYCEASEGLFDITIGAVSELWDFTEGIVPSAEQIERALPHVGWECVDVTDSTVTLADPEARIDLGGIAKGYIADRLIELFERGGSTSAFVNLGGNVHVLGAKPYGTPWRIGVRDPEGESDEQVVAQVESTGGSVVTSGLYERSFELDGQRYWHILDPRTGWPVQTSIASASIYSRDSLDGDGYTKPLFMWGADRRQAFCAEHPELQVLLIDVDGNATMSDGATFQLD